jgi:hypothetical protein
MTRVLLFSTFGLLATAIVLLETRARLASSPLPTLSEVASAVMRRRSARLAVLAGWLWLGWHLFAR